MARPAVLFGGPSPEHDISILTGLQAARALAQGGRDPIAIYWAKNGEFHVVDAGSEAKDFLAAKGYRGGIRTIGKGKSEPFQPDDPTGYTQQERWQLDRRVELERQ